MLPTPGYVLRGLQLPSKLCYLVVQSTSLFSWSSQETLLNSCSNDTHLEQHAAKSCPDLEVLGDRGSPLQCPTLGCRPQASCCRLEPNLQHLPRSNVATATLLPARPTSIEQQAQTYVMHSTRSFGVRSGTGGW